MKGRKLLAAALAAVMCLSAVPVNGTTTEAAASSRVQSIMEKMTLRQKITQMIMPDFRKWTLDVKQSAATDFTVMNDEVARIIEDYDFGGVILFANNVKTTEQSFNLVQDMQSAATEDGGTPMLIGIDQEGGIVYRLGSGSALPGNMALGATGSEDMAKRAGQILGRELSALGINTNFAPAVDVNNNPNNPVIGLRSFGDDPEAVAKLSVAMIEGMNDYNIITSAKHFPGHGDTATDSHTGLPVVDKSLEELKNCELVPFQAAMDAGTDMFMVAHICYPQVDPTKVISEKTREEVGIPATVSKVFLTDIVRDQMNYDGVLITDAMNMQGLSDIFGQVEACIRSVEAGIDILLMPCVLYDDEEDLKDMDAIIEGLENAVEAGRITEERLDQSVERILTLKEKRGILDYDAEDYSLENAKEQVGSKQNREEERKISAAAVTVTKNENDVLPLAPKAGEKVLLLAAYTNELPGLDLGFRRAKNAGLANGVTYETYRYASGTSKAVLRGKIADADYVICISEVGSAAQMHPTNWLTAKPALAASIAKELGKKSVIMSISKPYDVQSYDNADAVVAVYGSKGMDPTEGLIPDAAFGPNIVAGVEVILGVFGAQGKLPVNVYQYDAASKSYTDEIVYPNGYGLTYEARMADSGLGKMIAQAESLEEDEYTADSWAVVADALAAAKAVEAKKDAAQKEKDAALAVLIQAIGGLEYGTQTLHLKTAVEAADKIMELSKNYVGECEALAAVVDAGKAVLADKDAAQEEIDAAAYDILDELAKLAKKADIASLESLIDAAKELVNGKYTEETLDSLKDAIAKAEEVVADQNREQSDISNAYAGLINAIIGLQMKGNKAALKAMIAKAEEVLNDQKDYVEATINGLSDVLAEAKAVDDDVNAVQAVIDQAVKALTRKVAEARLLGDVDGDQAVTTRDSAVLLQYTAELTDLSDDALGSADVNGDGLANTNDAVLILQYAAEKVAAF